MRHTFAFTFISHVSCSRFCDGVFCRSSYPFLGGQWALGSGGDQTTTLNCVFLLVSLEKWNKFHSHYHNLYGSISLLYLCWSCPLTILLVSVLFPLRNKPICEKCDKSSPRNDSDREYISVFFDWKFKFYSFNFVSNHSIQMLFISSKSRCQPEYHFEMYNS